MTMYPREYPFLLVSHIGEFRPLVRSTYKLPRRKAIYVERPKKNLNFYVESVDDLIETSLQEFSRALSRAGKTPYHDT
jgi:hypothetical protein